MLLSCDSQSSCPARQPGRYTCSVQRSTASIPPGITALKQQLPTSLVQQHEPCHLPCTRNPLESLRCRSLLKVLLSGPPCAIIFQNLHMKVISLPR